MTEQFSTPYEILGDAGVKQLANAFYDVMDELTETAESADERFSPAPPESSLPQDPHAEGGDQEGAGGPFA